MLQARYNLIIAVIGSSPQDSPPLYKWDCYVLSAALKGNKNRLRIYRADSFKVRWELNGSDGCAW